MSLPALYFLSCPAHGLILQSYLHFICLCKKFKLRSQGGDLATFSDQNEGENWIGNNYYYNALFWIGLRQYDAEGTDGQVRTTIQNDLKKIVLFDLDTGHSGQAPSRGVTSRCTVILTSWLSSPAKRYLIIFLKMFAQKVFQ
jgi:hypothetical protein